jgi:hypothetical protein
MSDAETIDPPLQGSSLPPRVCRSDGGRGVAGEAAGGIPRGFHDGIRPSFWYNKQVFAPVSPPGAFRFAFDPRDEAASCRPGNANRAGTARGGQWDHAGG